MSETEQQRRIREAQAEKDAAVAELRDAARRMSEHYNLMLLAQGVGACGRWMAFSMADGRTDDVLYDTREDAVRHQLHERQCYYAQLLPDGMTPRTAANLLFATRQLYNSQRGWMDPKRYTHLPLDTAGTGLVLPPPRRARA